MGWLQMPFLNLEMLNRDTLPPRAFNSAGLGDVELLPGELVTFQAPVSPNAQYVALYATARFSGDSSHNRYRGVGGEWWGGWIVPRGRR